MTVTVIALSDFGAVRDALIALLAISAVALICIGFP